MSEGPAPLSRLTAELSPFEQTGRPLHQVEIEQAVRQPEDVPVFS